MRGTAAGVSPYVRSLYAPGICLTAVLASDAAADELVAWSALAFCAGGPTAFGAIAVAARLAVVLPGAL